MEYPLSDTFQTSERIQEVMADIASRPEWHEEVSKGKMFGLLIYRDHEGNEGMLKAYSGQICGRSDWPGYVPAIFDYLQPDGYFRREEAEIVRLHSEGRPTRERSIALQRWLFSQTMLCNACGEKRSVLDVFGQWAKENHSKQTMPPSGTGECCAPKLLHYANMHGLTPLRLTEFWYGASPKGEIRHHGMQYEPCQAKCMTILGYLAPPSTFDLRPSTFDLPILFDDPCLLAADKPAGLLSVPGKRQTYCAEDILKEQTGLPFLRAVHRLDMDTSGILLFAKTEEAYKAMQRMFALHEGVEKEYVAIVAALQPHLLNSSGEATFRSEALRSHEVTLRRSASSVSHGPEIIQTISLPLSPDFLNRPRQLVDYEHGKPATTRYVVVDGSGSKFQDKCVGETNSSLFTLHSSLFTLRLFPLTGRTHQLRIHCAHPDGLGSPILGDRLYGNIPADRMYLHATRLAFTHPLTGEHIEINSPAPWEGNLRPSTFNLQPSTFDLRPFDGAQVPTLK